MNLRPFNFYRVYLDRSICQMYAMSSAPEVELLRNLRSFKSRERKIHGPRMFTRASSIKLGIGKFHVVVVQWTSKKCTKKHDVRAELLFFLTKPLKKKTKKGSPLKKVTL